MSNHENVSRRHHLRQPSRSTMAQSVHMPSEYMDIENIPYQQPMSRQSRCNSRRKFGTNITNCMSRQSFKRDVVKGKSPKEQLRQKKISRKLLESLDTKQHSQQHQPLDISNTQTLPYENSIMQYIKSSQITNHPPFDFILMQSQIDENMRNILVNWLVDVHTKFRLRSETLFLCINLIDRYMAEEDVMVCRFQLLGITSLFIASKYEEIHVPDIKNYVEMCDGAYRVADLLEMESSLLLRLQFSLSHTSSLTHAQHHLQQMNLSGELLLHTSYILHLCLVDYRMCRYLPSLTALSAIYLSSKILNTKKVSSAALLRNFELDEQKFKECLRDMFQTFKQKQQKPAVKRKFARLGLP